MNIKEFKVGDVITRNEPVNWKKGELSDGSFCGDRITLKGHDLTSKIIFFVNDNISYDGEILDLSYARDPWDEGWCYYPETLWQKIKKIVKKVEIKN